jgi:hypothetical protein
MMTRIHTLRREQAFDAPPETVFAYRAEPVPALLS